MSRNGGFTLVELLITIIIMVILMTLAVANIRSSQVSARDKERTSDVKSMARHLDSLYTKGVSYTCSSTTIALKGSYPSTDCMNDSTVRSAIFVEIPPGTQIDPAQTTSDASIFPATNTKTGTDSTDTTNRILPFPSATAPYVYQAFTTGGSRCYQYTQTCTSFRFYYFQEATPTIAGVVKSGYQ